MVNMDFGFITNERIKEIGRFMSKLNVTVCISSQKCFIYLPKSLSIIIHTEKSICLVGNTITYHVHMFWEKITCIFLLTIDIYSEGGTEFI